MRTIIVDSNPVTPEKPHVLTRVDCVCGFQTSGVCEETAYAAMRDHIAVYTALGLSPHTRVGRSHELLPDVREVMR